MSDVRRNDAYEPHRLQQNAESERAARKCKHAWVEVEDEDGEAAVTRECNKCGTRVQQFHTKSGRYSSEELGRVRRKP